MDKTTVISKISFFPLEITLPILAFTIPFLVSGPQWLTGTLVNSFLIIFIAKLSKKNILPIITLPSIGALLRGVVFGPLTLFLFYFLPFIWMGNYLLVKIFEKLSQRINFLGGVFISAFVKSLFLYLTAFFFFRLNIVPAVFLKTMGLIQFYTALIGGFLAYFIIKLLNKNYDRA